MTANAIQSSIVEFTQTYDDREYCMCLDRVVSLAMHSVDSSYRMVSFIGGRRPPGGFFLRLFVRGLLPGCRAWALY